MGLFRSIQTGFWTDTKIEEDFTPEDKYFYLYLLTNTHTNLCGCYEISLTQIANDMGYTKEAIEKLIYRFEKLHNVIRYSYETKELLIINWSKYNWTSSEKFLIRVDKELSAIKNSNFKEFLIGLRIGKKDTVLNESEYGIDRVSIGDLYPSDTTISISNTNTISNSNININSLDNLERINSDEEVKEEKPKEKVKDIKKNIAKAIPKKDEPFFEDSEVDMEFREYIAMRKKKDKSFTDHARDLAIKEIHKLADNNGVLNKDLALAIIRQTIFKGWKGFFPLSDNTPRGNPTQKPNMMHFENQTDYDFDEYEKMILNN